MGNIVSDIYRTYQKYVPNPLAQGAIFAGLSVPAVYLTQRIAYNRLKRLAQDPRAAMLAGMTPQQAQASLQQMQESTFFRHGLPWLAGALAFTAGTVPNLNFDKQGWGLTEWYPKDLPKEGQKEDSKKDAPKQEQKTQQGITKNNSLYKMASLWGDQGYQPSFDFNTPIIKRDAISMFNDNPQVQQNDYARNLGTSILASAPAYGGQTTLGSIYDSAVNKFDKKLSYEGLGKSALKGAIRGGLAGLFTDTIGAVFGVPDPLRRSIANSVGFGTAICSILA